MFAFGLPAGRVLLVSVVESLIIGLLGTIVGLVGRSAPAGVAAAGPGRPRRSRTSAW